MSFTSSFNPILRGHSWWGAMPSVASAFYLPACDTAESIWETLFSDSIFRFSYKVAWKQDLLWKSILTPSGSALSQRSGWEGQGSCTWPLGWYRLQIPILPRAKKAEYGLFKTVFLKLIQMYNLKIPDLEKLAVQVQIPDYDLWFFSWYKGAKLV